MCSACKPHHMHVPFTTQQRNLIKSHCKIRHNDNAFTPTFPHLAQQAVEHSHLARQLWHHPATSRGLLILWTPCHASDSTVVTPRVTANVKIIGKQVCTALERVVKPSSTSPTLFAAAACMSGVHETRVVAQFGQRLNDAKDLRWWLVHVDVM